MRAFWINIPKLNFRGPHRVECDIFIIVIRIKKSLIIISAHKLI